MSINEELEIERLERILRSTTPAVTPPSIGTLQNIRAKRQRRNQIASRIGALVLVAGSIGLGGIALQASGSFTDTDAAITTLPDGAAITATDVAGWLESLPPNTSTSELFVASPIPRPDVVYEFIGCAWIESWRDGIESGDTDQAARSLGRLEISADWPVSQLVEPGTEGFAADASRARASTTVEEVEASTLWNRCH